MKLDEVLMTPLPQACADFGRPSARAQFRSRLRRPEATVTVFIPICSLSSFATAIHLQYGWIELVILSTNTTRSESNPI
jgi:hypothetical protein